MQGALSATCHQHRPCWTQAFSNLQTWQTQMWKINKGLQSKSFNQVTDTATQSSSTGSEQPPVGQQSSLAQILELVLHSPPRTKLTGLLSSSSLVALGEGLPLISKRTIERIQEGDYIDFWSSPCKGKG